MTQGMNSMTSLTLFCFLYCKLCTDVMQCSGVFVDDFEQVNASWEDFAQKQLCEEKSHSKLNKKDTRISFVRICVQ